MPVPDALLFTEVSYKMHFIIVLGWLLKVQRICNRLHTKYDVSSAINVAESLRTMKYSVGSVEQ